MSKQESCANCKFWDREYVVEGEDPEGGDCYAKCMRYPPVLISFRMPGEMLDTHMFGQPWVDHWRWCGEWRASE